MSFLLHKEVSIMRETEAFDFQGHRVGPGVLRHAGSDDCDLGDVDAVDLEIVRKQLQRGRLFAAEDILDEKENRRHGN